MGTNRRRWSLDARPDVEVDGQLQVGEDFPHRIPRRVRQIRAPIVRIGGEVPAARAQPFDPRRLGDAASTLHPGMIAIGNIRSLESSWISAIASL